MHGSFILWEGIIEVERSFRIEEQGIPQYKKIRLAGGEMTSRMLQSAVKESLGRWRRFAQDEMAPCSGIVYIVYIVYIV